MKIIQRPFAARAALLRFAAGPRAGPRSQITPGKHVEREVLGMKGSIELQAANNKASLELEAAKNKAALELDAAKNLASVQMTATINAKDAAMTASINHASLLQKIAECCCEQKALVIEKSSKTDDLIRQLQIENLRDSRESEHVELVALRLRASLVPALVPSVSV